MGSTETQSVRNRIIIGDSLAEKGVLTITEAVIEIAKLERAIDGARDYQTRQAQSVLFEESRLSEGGLYAKNPEDTGLLPKIPDNVKQLDAYTNAPL